MRTELRGRGGRRRCEGRPDAGVSPRPLARPPAGDPHRPIRPAPAATSGRRQQAQTRQGSREARRPRYPLTVCHPGLLRDHQSPLPRRSFHPRHLPRAPPTSRPLTCPFSTRTQVARRVPRPGARRGLRGRFSLEHECERNDAWEPVGGPRGGGRHPKGHK